MLYKMTIALSIMGASAMPAPDPFLGHESLRDLFVAWKAEHGKVYTSQTEEAAALDTFARTNAKIVSHNAIPGVSWTMGHNKFSDLTAEQFAFYTGFRPTNATGIPEHVVDSSVTLPEAFDIEEASCTTKVKNQQSCGSCWAFSAIGAIEGQLCNGETLSEQELVDCGPGAGCNGGSMEQAFSWVRSNGITSERNYPYKARTGSCNAAAKAKPVATVGGYSRVSSESGLKSAVAGRPISIAVDATCLQSYRSGIIDDSSCYRSLDHGVLLTGYGTSGGTAYWKVKNSWGSSWGEAGYFRAISGKSMLGIGKDSSYPTGVKKAVETIDGTFQWPAVYSGASLSLTWEDCGNGQTHATVTDIQPNSVTLGSTTKITGEGNVDSDQAGGSYELTMEGLGGVALLNNCKGDAAKDGTCSIGLGPITVGKLSYKGLAFPQKAGHVSGIALDLSLAAGLPSFATETTTTFKVASTDGSPMICAKIYTKPN